MGLPVDEVKRRISERLGMRGYTMPEEVARINALILGTIGHDPEFVKVYFSQPEIAADILILFDEAQHVPTFSKQPTEAEKKELKAMGVLWEEGENANSSASESSPA